MTANAQTAIQVPAAPSEMVLGERMSNPNTAPSVVGRRSKMASLGVSRERTMDGPKPAPPSPRRVVKTGSKALPASVAAVPRPLSARVSAGSMQTKGVALPQVSGLRLGGDGTGAGER